MACSLTVILLIAPGFSLDPILVNHTTGQVVLANDSNRADKNDKDEGKDDKDKKDKKEKKDKPDRGDGDKDVNGDGTNPVVAAAEDYTVETECEFDDDDNITKCEFSGIAPDDASDIGRLTVPADALCAEVLDGDFVFIAPDSGMSATGYASEEDDDKLKLELHGEVTTAGTTTYWVSTIGSVIPAEGPALRCDPLEFSLTSATVTPTPPVTTGTLVVATYTCENVPEDTSTFDWFGMCVPGSGPLGFTLSSTDVNAAAQHAAGTDASTGEATFNRITPGTYQLTSADASWCHAKSDRVNAQGEVVIRAGEQATVWTFYCGAGKQ